jgi:CRP-like cAMP-binding protein
VTSQLLARLARADARLLEPHLEAVDLPVRKLLQARNRRVERVYFPDSGIASVVANGDIPIEVGMIGRDGMTGVSVLLGDDERAQHETYMQVGGKGWCLAADYLREAIAKSSALHQVLLRYVQVFLRQPTETALANGRGKIEERLARWLLMAHDRVDGDEIALTHEFLSVMLGVRRSGVTIAVEELQRKGFIAHRRSLITIVDRKGLEDSSNGTYVASRGD